MTATRRADAAAAAHPPPPGIDLGMLSDRLLKVPVHLDRNPVASFDARDAIGPKARAYLDHEFDSTGWKFKDAVGNLPLRAFAGVTTDQLCKIRYSQFTMMDQSVEKAFETDPTLLTIRKIENSAWRWGMTKPAWNEIVDAWDGIRRFDIGVPGMSATLDFTTGYNERGYSRHSRTYIDGVMAFLVHHRGKHVMTVGFSVAAGRRLLLQQVQLTSPRGNRWLFGLPRPRLEFVMDRLSAAFPRHRILVADGGQIASRNLASYRDGVERLAETARRADLAAARPGAGEDEILRAREAARDLEALQARHDRLEGDVARIAEGYRQTGRYALGKPRTYNGIAHRPAVAAGDAPGSAPGPG